MEEDYRLKFERLVRLSRNINRLSPRQPSRRRDRDRRHGDRRGEPAQGRGRPLQERDHRSDHRRSGRRQARGRYAAFTYRRRPLPEVFAAGALFDAAWLAVFNILAFALAYAGFVRYDVR